MAQKSAICDESEKTSNLVNLISAKVIWDWIVLQKNGKANLTKQDEMKIKQTVKIQLHSPFSFSSPMQRLMESESPRVAAEGIVPRMEASDGPFRRGTPSSCSSCSGLFCSSFMRASSVSSSMSFSKCLATAWSSSSSSGSSRSMSAFSQSEREAEKVELR